MSEDRKWLISLLSVKPDVLKKDGFPEGSELGSLPDLLNAAIEGMSPHGAVDLDSVYLLTDEQKTQVVRYLETHSLPYHEHAVQVRGEKCVDPECKEHYQCVVIRLHDRRKSGEEPGEAAPA